MRRNVTTENYPRPNPGCWLKNEWRLPKLRLYAAVVFTDATEPDPLGLTDEVPAGSAGPTQLHIRSLRERNAMHIA
jgi:hypothetical protein